MVGTVIGGERRVEEELSLGTVSSMRSGYVSIPYTVLPSIEIFLAICKIH